MVKVIRPLYGIPEAGNHWFKTYHTHHAKKLNMDQSTYDPCLLHMNDSTTAAFGIIGLDTLILANPSFARTINIFSANNSSADDFIIKLNKLLDNLRTKRYFITNKKIIHYYAPATEHKAII